MLSEFRLKEGSCICNEIREKLHENKNRNVKLDFSLFTSYERNQILKSIDYEAGDIVIADADFSGVYFPDSIDLSYAKIINCKNIGAYLENVDFENTTFENCTFSEFEIRDPTSIQNLTFKDCEFKECKIQTDLDLDQIKWVGKIPPSYEFVTDSNTKLPEWQLKNLGVDIALNNTNGFSKQEIKDLGINYNTVNSCYSLQSTPDKINREILDKIFRNINTDLTSCFDGIDFSGYSFPDVDLSGCGFAGCNLQDAEFISNIDDCDFRNARIAGCDFGDYEPELKFAIKERTKDKKTMKSNSGDVVEFSPEQLKTIRNYTAAAPAVANMCRKAVKRLLRFILTKAGKAKSTITSYVNVAMDLLEDFKDEANMLFQLMIGFVCANLHKVGEYFDEKSFLKYFSSKKVQAFGEFCLANGQGSIFASLAKRATDFAEMFAGEIFANSDFQRIAAVIENPETATRIADSSAEDESETEVEAAPVKKTRKHS